MTNSLNWPIFGTLVNQKLHKIGFRMSPGMNLKNEGIEHEGCPPKFR